MTRDKTITVRRYHVWDRTTRWFHWINFLCFIALAAAGLVLFNGKRLGIEGDAKILVKAIHVYVGYLFAINLIWRLVWAFASSNRFARWKAILPFGRGYVEEVRCQLAHLRNGKPGPYLGHSPMGRAMIALLLLLLTIQAGTGLVLAGTDLYMPPFGDSIAHWVAVTDENGSKADELIPGSMTDVDPSSHREMRAFRAPIVGTHEIVFYFLLLAIVLHIAAAVWTDVREKSGLISAMFTGQKFFAEKPLDEDRLQE